MIENGAKKSTDTLENVLAFAIKDNKCEFVKILLE